MRRVRAVRTPTSIARSTLGFVVAAAVAGLVSCSAPPRPATQAPPGPSPSREASCPAAYAAPDPLRPVVTLRFDLSADHATVAGTEKVVFRPDRPVTEMIFRLIPNGIEGKRSGARMTVTAASATMPVTAGSGGPALRSNRVSYESAGATAGTQGTILRLALPRPARAGEAITADLTFVLALPGPASDRLGHTSATAWWGSGQPLLAWDSRSGWVVDPISARQGETATSEAADTDVTVTAPASDTVLATGTQDPAVPAGGGQMRWHSHAAAARDVAVAASSFRVQRAVIGGVPVTVGVSPEVPTAPATIIARLRDAIPDHVRRFGPYPFSSLVVSALPGLESSGVEYPGAVFVGATQDYSTVVSHELAHQWFYGLVGDNQAEHPWLDEAFATYAEALDNGTESTYTPSLTLPGPVDAPTYGFQDEKTYVLSVYYKGSAALLDARAAAGATRFDAAIRCYVTRNAWRIATPADLAAALTGLPVAVAHLRTAGAL